MNALSTKLIRSMAGCIFAGMLLITFIGLSNMHTVQAQGLVTETAIGGLTATPFPTNSPEENASPTNEQTGEDQGSSALFPLMQRISLPDGKQVEQIIINGPPTPPIGISRATAAQSELIGPASVKTLDVPAYGWSFGCTATSASMIAAFYDRTGYDNIYTGSTNGGVMPMDSSIWLRWTDGDGKSYEQNPLTASRNGLDGRSTRGSIDDYWVSYLSGIQDPFITNSWTEHTYGSAIGDYMRTSQSKYGNDDGSTTYYYWPDGSPLSCSDSASLGLANDFSYGRSLFYQARGYSVTDCYNQLTDTRGGKFTFAMYKAEIDAGHPVILNLSSATEGHSVVGVGYDTATSTVYIHDTWDYLTHSMNWSGIYAEMSLQAVGVVNLAPLGNFSLTVNKSGTGSGSVTSSPAAIDCGATCSHDFPANTSITLTARSSAFSIFSGWSGGGCSGTGTCTVDMTSDQSVTAAFKPGIVIYRQGAWLKYDFDSSALVEGVWTGMPNGNCIPAPMDFNGDGVKDFSQLCNGAWFFHDNNGAIVHGIWVGDVAGQVPVPGDYDGDGKDDIVLFRDGAWLYYDYATGALTKGVWTGAPVFSGTPVPVPMDVNGDGALDYTVYSGGPWFFFNADGSMNKGIWTGGVAGDMAVPGNYDGLGKDEIVIFRGGAWLFYDFTSGALTKGVWTGAPIFNGTPLPSPLDFTGDGLADFTVFSGGPWFFFKSNGSMNSGIWTGGVDGDLPISNRYLP